MPEDTLDPVVIRELAAVDDALAGRRVDPDLYDLAELTTLLAGERPRIDPRFARELDARAAQGFDGRRGRASAGDGVRRRLAAFRPYLLPALGTAMLPLIVVILIVSGGGGGGGDRSASSGAGAGESPESAARDSAAGQSAGGGQESASAGSVAAPETAVGDAGGATAASGGSPGSDGRATRKVERSATLSLAAAPRDFGGVVDGIVRVTDRNDGFVRSSNVAAAGEYGTGSFELRVPTARLGRVLAELSRLAHVRERSQATQDITARSVSARERLQEVLGERERLLVLLADATTVNETTSIRARLRIVGREIAAARGAVARVDNRAAFSTVSVTLEADAGAEDAGGAGRWTPGDALRDAGRVLEVTAGVLVIALAVLLPLAAVAALGTLAGRRVARRRRERALDAV